MATRPTEQPRPRTNPETVEVGASRSAPTAARALRVVELLASDTDRTWKLADLQRELGFSHGNLHAILATLVAMGHVRREPGSRAYTLGPALLAIGAAARRAYPTVDLAEPYLERLAAELNTEAAASMQVGSSLLIVARCGPALPSGAGVLVGERIPLTPPLGSTIMAWATDHDLKQYLATADGALTPAEIASLRESLKAVRRRGYSVHVYTDPNVALSETAMRILTEGSDDDVDAELTGLAHELGRTDYLPQNPDTLTATDGVQLSAPVFNERGAVVLSVGVAFAGQDVDLAAVVSAPTVLLETTAAITAAIGGRVPSERAS